MSSPLYLLKTQRFAPLFTTQFLGAFNDNLFKNTLAVILTFHAGKWTTLSPSLLAPLIGALFILPFFLFSGMAGELADKYDKARLTRIVKLLEFFLMALATAGFMFHSLELLFSVIFGLGVHSTLFGPIKYSILPQHMHENELISANALIESGTFAAILLGTLSGGILSTYANGGILAGGAAMILAAMGYQASRHIPNAPSLTNDISLSLNPITPTLHSITHARKNPVVFASILSISWFWLYGALLLTQLPPFVKITLAGNETTVTLLLALFTIGIGAGSMLCNLLSNHTIRPSLIAVGAIGMALVGIDFGLTAQHFQTANSLYSNLSFWHILIDLTLIGVFGGLYSVPLYALMQMLSDPVFRSRIIAANNILNALFMVAGAVITILLLNQGWSIPDIFLTMALCTAVVAGVISFKLRKI